jgi:uncharacterized protein
VTPGAASVPPIVVARQATLPLGAPVPRPGVPELSEADAPAFEDPRQGLEVGTWEGSPSTFRARRDGYSEICHILAGHATLDTDGGPSVEVRAGDTIVFPSGWSGRWRVHERMRKLYVIVHDRVPPIAGGTSSAAPQLLDE